MTKSTCELEINASSTGLFQLKASAAEVSKGLFEEGGGSCWWHCPANGPETLQTEVNFFWPLYILFHSLAVNR